MNSAYLQRPHRIVAGNYFSMAVRLSQITWGNNTQSTTAFTPASGDRFQVSLIQHGKGYRCSNVTIDGSTLTFTINGNIAPGLYSLEILVTRADNKRLRSLQKNKIEIVCANEEAGIPDDDEFQTETIQLDGAILMVVEGAEFQWDDTPTLGSGAAVTSDGIKQALNQLETSISESSSTSSSVINLNSLLSSTDTYTLTSAISALAAYEESTEKTYRKSGLVLSYMTGENTWQSKQFFGADVADFADETLWDDFGGVADEEFDADSEKPVMNKTVTEALAQIHALLAQKHAIVSMEQTTVATESEGENIITVTFDNDETVTFSVRNGAQGEQGPKGDTVILGNENTYNLYTVLGTNEDGAITQKKVTEVLTAMFADTLTSTDVASLSDPT